MDSSFTLTQRALVLTTFVLGILLAILPLPSYASLLRPDWVALVLVYWCMAIPNRVGVGSAWLLGLLLDVLYGSLLGEQALAKAVLAFVALRFTLRLRVFPRWQQAIAVGTLIAASDLLILMMNALIHGTPPIWSDTAPMVANVILWPFLFAVLREVRRRAKIS
ncbi:MAG: rod shape-determining protein MreD [Acidiferrobacter sp.]